MRPALELFILNIVVTAPALVSLLFLSPVALFIWLFVVFLIVDTGAGVPLLWAFVSLFMQPFRPTLAYQQLKSKFLLRS